MNYTLLLALCLFYLVFSLGYYTRSVVQKWEERKDAEAFERDNDDWF